MGGGGNDILDGGLGIDSLSGGTGNDTYIVDNTSDIVRENVNAGTDTVKSSASFTLPANVEHLTLTGTFALNGTGNSSKNTLIGNAAANKLTGNAGDDILDGNTGVDSLYGGAGNDILKIKGYNGDIIDGGTGNQDILQITGSDHNILLWDFIQTSKNIEILSFLGDGNNQPSNNRITLTAQSVIDLSSDSDTLRVLGGKDDTLIFNNVWHYGGIDGMYKVFTLNGATVEVTFALGNIIMPESPSSTYTISDTTTAEQVGSFFTDGADEVVIDFGGIQYNETSLLYGEMIDLSGFGLEDKLIIASHDGHLDKGTATYNGSAYILEYYGSEEFHSSDAVYWQPGATSASLRSAKKTHQFTPSGAIVYSTTSFTIQLTGLPAGLAESQFVFV